METFLDELAHRAGKDPLAFRLAFAQEKPRAAGVLEKVAKTARWGSPAPGTKQGLAFGFWANTPVATVAEVSMNGTTPRVHRAFVVADVGIAINPTIVRQQLEGATNYGLSMALASKITIANGRRAGAEFLRLPGVAHRSSTRDSRRPDRERSGADRNW